MKLKLMWLLLACSLITFGCSGESVDDDPEAGTETEAGESNEPEAGEDNEPEAGNSTSGTAAGDTAGTESGTPAGDEAGTPAGEVAGDMVSGGDDIPEAGTSSPNICNEIVEVGATCDTSNDCCARGSFCQPQAETGTEGQCVRACEIPAEGDAIGCEERELCLEAGEPGPDGTAPGYCLVGDDCEPGNENLACGEGEFSCLRLRNISLCVDIGEARSASPDVIVGEGEPCDFFSDTDPAICDTGLVCEFNGIESVCRKGCSADSQCADGESCLDYSTTTDGLSYQFCSPVCDIETQNCGPESACVITDIVNEVLFGTCIEQGADNLAALGEECRSIFDDVPNDPFCGPGLTCETNGIENVCMTLCDADDQCGEGESCLAATNRYNEYFTYGFCATTCDAATQDCGESGVCSFTDVIDDVLYGTCVEVGVEGRAALGEACRNPIGDDDEALPFCQQGYSCEFNGVESVCTSLCGNTSDCEAGQDCVNAADRYNELFQYNFCATNCDVIAQDCPDGQACAFNGVRDGVPSGECVDTPAGTALNAEACTVDEVSYWGTCDANSVCFLDEEGSDTGTCGSFCTADDPSVCDGEGQVCADSSIEGLGLCQTTCNVFSDDGCDAGESCIWTFGEAPTSEGALTPIGFCEENPNAGQVGLEEVCVIYEIETADGPFEYPYFNNCGAGQICIGVAEGQPPVCLKNCNMDDPSAVECGPGETCLPLWEGVQTMGVCFEGE